MAKKIIRLSRTKEQKQANRERNERANRTILSRTLILMILCGVIAFVPLIGTLYHHSLPFYPETRISDDVLLYYLEAPEVMELAEDDPSILEYEQLKNLKEDDNPVLMIVYLK